MKPLFDNFNNFGNTLDTIEISNKLIHHPFTSFNGVSFYIDSFKTINNHYNLNIFKFYDHYMDYLNIPTIFRIPFMFLLVTTPMIVSKYYGNMFKVLYGLFLNSINNNNDNGTSNNNSNDSDSEDNENQETGYMINNSLFSNTSSDSTVTAINVSNLNRQQRDLIAREMNRRNAERQSNEIHVYHPADNLSENYITEIFHPSQKTMYENLNHYLTSYNKSSENCKVLTDIDYQTITKLITDENLSQIITLFV